MITDWGTIKQRIGGESFKEFGSCCLCLNTASRPVACNHGHIFCKECILSNIISQKQLYREKKTAWKSSLKKQSSQAIEINILQQESKKKKFIDSENGLNCKESWEKFDDQRKYGLMSKDQQDHARAKAFLQSKDKKTLSKHELIQQSFWVADLTPDSGKTSEKPSKIIKCPEGNHKISTKNIKDIKAEVEKESQKMLCCGCLAPFAYQTAVLIECGHVFCSNCLDPASTSCLKCGQKCENAKKHIRLAQGSTNFASHNNVEAKIYKPAFQS